MKNILVAVAFGKAFGFDQKLGQTQVEKLFVDDFKGWGDFPLGLSDLVGLKSGQFPFFRFASLSMFFRLGAVEVVLACCFMGTVIPTAPPMDLLFQLCNSSLLFFVFPVLLLELYCFLLSVGSVVARVAFQPGGRKLPNTSCNSVQKKPVMGDDQLRLIQT